MNAAPVALFVYNRPQHTKRTAEALAGNKLAAETELYVFADGPKAGASAEDLEKIKQVREAVSSLTGFKKVNLVFSDVNKGLSASITNGINSVLEKHDRIVVFEDDIVAHPAFLEFCNKALADYENATDVFAISGFSFPVKGNLPPTYFIRFGATWGWGCWRRSWKYFTMDADKLMHEIESSGRRHEFDFDGNHQFFLELKRQKEGLINGWDVCWYASIFVRKGLAYYPFKSLTMNIGMDGTGTHYNASLSSGSIHTGFSVTEEECNAILNYKPETIALNVRAQQAMTNYFFTYQKGGMINKMKHILRKYGKIKI